MTNIEKEVKQEPSASSPRQPVHCDQNDFNLGALFLGILLIGIGSLYLLQNLAIGKIFIAGNITDFWPVLIVAAGLSLIRPKGLGGSLLKVIVIIVALAILYAIATAPPAYVHWDVL